MTQIWPANPGKTNHQNSASQPNKFRQDKPPKSGQPTPPIPVGKVTDVRVKYKTVITHLLGTKTAGSFYV